MRTLLILVASLCAALMPLLESHVGKSKISSTNASELPGSWPTQWHGLSLRPLPLTPQERKFSEAFPGAMARFTDGTDEILFRRVNQPTRRLHPSSDCLRASGYAIEPLPAKTSMPNHTWSCFLARRGEESLLVYEMVVAGNGDSNSDRSWTDISSWYWQVFWGQKDGPWTAITVSRRLLNSKV